MIDKYITNLFVLLKIAKTDGTTFPNGKYLVIGLNWRNPLSWVAMLVFTPVAFILGGIKTVIDVWIDALKSW